MGKISDALERYKKEKSVKADTLLSEKPTELPVEALARPGPELVIEHGFSHKVVSLSAPDSLDAENFKILRAQVLFPKDGKRPKVIMITSAFPGEGKTFVAANLAVSMAMGINEHVLLVDCDLRRSTMQNFLGYSGKPGLYEYLTGKRRLPDLLIRTRIKKLSVLFAGRKPLVP